MAKTNFAKDQLKSLIERVERLEEEKAALAADIKAVYGEAKGMGFDTAVMRALVKERKVDKSTRATFEALLEIYRAAVGMLDGTPLGDAARRRLSRQEKRDEDAGNSGADGAADAPSGEAAAAPTEKPAEFPAADLDAARTLGRADAAGGKRVIDNPYTAGDPRRAAWDEGWCAETGSDGMDIPDAWRRDGVKRPKKKDAAPEDA